MTNNNSSSAPADDGVVITAADAAAINDIDYWITMTGAAPGDEREVLSEALRRGHLGQAVDTENPERGMHLLMSLASAGRGLDAATAATVVFTAHTSSSKGRVAGLVIAGPSTHMAAPMMRQNPTLAAAYMASVMKIQAIAVTPDARRHGIGHHLLAHLITHATAAEYQILYGQYDRNRDTTLRPFYTAHGFTIHTPGTPANLRPALGPLADNIQGFPNHNEVMFDRTLTTTPLF